MKEAAKIVTLGEVCTKGTSNITIKSTINDDGQYPLFGASGFIKNVSFYDNDKPYLSIVKDGAGVGRVSKMDACTSVIGTLQYIHPNNGIDLNYLYYFFLSIDFKKYSSGAAIPHIYFKDYKNEPFVLVPLSEQKRIVSILDKAFDAIEKAKANAEESLNNSKGLFESYLNNIFVNNGEDWEEKRIRDIARVINGYAFSSKDFKPTNSIKSIKITNVGVKEFVEEASNYLPEKFKFTLKDVMVKKGDIVIALTRTIIAAGLKVAIVPQSYDGALLNQRVAALRPDENIMHNKFLYYFLTTSGVAKYVLSHVNTLMQPNLSIHDLKNLPIPCPRMKRQQAIVHQLDFLKAHTEKLEEIYQKKIEYFEKMKESLLQKAFNGEL
jgi:type I restriction enzyme S subunit